MPGRDDKAFTLLEILLAITVMALLAASVIGMSSHLVGRRSTNPDDVFWKACAASRRLALESGVPAQLGFDDKTNAFTYGNGGATQALAVPSPGDDFAVSFLTNQAGASAVLIGGTLVETQTVKQVVFYPDGTCTPFRVQIRQHGGAHVLNIDPWTCARVLTRGDANGGAPL